MPVIHPTQPTNPSSGGSTSALSDNQLRAEVIKLDSGAITMEQFLQAVGGLNTTLSDGESLLDVAASLNCPTAATDLINAGFNVNMERPGMQGLLHIIMSKTYSTPNDPSSEESWVSVAKAMINNGADVTSSANGDCPFMDAVYCAQKQPFGLGDQSLLNLILSKDPGLVNMPLAQAPYNALAAAVKVNDLSLVQDLVQHGANVNGVSSSASMDVLNYSLAMGYSDIAKYLISQGAQ